MADHFDVLVVGAGLSGIGAAWHLQRQAPDRSFAILEARDDIGGTWDLFRYPGIRSDSDMYTLGYRFKPWTEAKAIADGPSILRYVRETATENGIDRHIRFGHRVMAAHWSTADAAWTVEVEHNGIRQTLTCNFLFMCSGYYNYAQGYAPDFAGSASFGGPIVHPQHWPEELDYANKRVVVIGSGATAVTLVPEMARTAAHVTMLQRSPTYVVSRPAEDGVANWLRARLPAKLAYRLTRWKNVLLGMLFYRFARKRPERTKERMLGMVRAELGPDYDIATHFTPSYNPWDQRVCLVPDADLFASIKAGRSEVVTGYIDRFDATGVSLADGRHIDADIIVTATGLDLQVFAGVPFTIDGHPRDLTQELIYRGMMLSGVPNFAFTFGYTNASWTLKADLVSGYVCRLLNTMRRRGVRQATPTLDRATVQPDDFVDFSSGYIQRAAAKLPQQGDRKPWRLNQNYALDIVALRFGSVGADMTFSNPAPSMARSAA
jgi:monooxygenase